MLDRRPEIRANWTRMLLDHLERTLGRRREEVLGSLDTHALERVRRAGPLEWLPAEIHVSIAVAPHAVVGADAYRALWRGMTLESLDRPLFRPLVEGALAVFKGSPARLFRVVPHGWSLVGRHCGELSIGDESARGLAMVWDKIPLLFRSAEPFATAWAGSLDSVLDIVHRGGRVAMDASRLGAGRVRYEITW